MGDRHFSCRLFSFTFFSEINSYLFLALCNVQLDINFTFLLSPYDNTEKKTMGALQQFGLLLWKNWLLQKRKKLLTFFEIALPTAVALILLWIRQLVTVEVIDSKTVWPPFTVDELFDGIRPPDCRMMMFKTDCPWSLAYAPDTEVTQRLIERVANRLGMDIIGKYPV